MNYLCLCYYDHRTFLSWTPSDIQNIIEQCKPHDEALRGSGHLRFVGSLGMPEESHTLRSVDGKTVADDKPYADTEEPIGAFFMIEAADMEEAKKIAGMHPGAKLSHLFGGGIEIRPVGLFDQL